MAHYYQLEVAGLCIPKENRLKFLNIYEIAMITMLHLATRTSIVQNYVYLFDCGIQLKPEIVWHKLPLGGRLPMVAQHRQTVQEFKKICDSTCGLSRKATLRELHKWMNLAKPNKETKFIGPIYIPYRDI